MPSASRVIVDEQQPFPKRVDQFSRGDQPLLRKKRFDIGDWTISLKSGSPHQRVGRPLMNNIEPSVEIPRFA